MDFANDRSDFQHADPIQFSRQVPASKTDLKYMFFLEIVVSTNSINRSYLKVW